VTKIIWIYSCFNCNYLVLFLIYRDACIYVSRHSTFQAVSVKVGWKQVENLGCYTPDRSIAYWLKLYLCICMCIIIRDIQAISFRIYYYKCDVLCLVNCLDVRTSYLGMCVSDVCTLKLLICVLSNFDCGNKFMPKGECKHIRQHISACALTIPCTMLNVITLWTQVRSNFLCRDKRSTGTDLIHYCIGSWSVTSFLLFLCT